MKVLTEKEYELINNLKKGKWIIARLSFNIKNDIYLLKYYKKPSEYDIIMNPKESTFDNSKIIMVDNETKNGRGELSDEILQKSKSDIIFKDDFYYYLTEFIKDHGKVSALLMLCIAVAVMVFLKNFFRDS